MLDTNPLSFPSSPKLYFIPPPCPRILAKPLPPTLELKLGQALILHTVKIMKERVRQVRRARKKWGEGLRKRGKEREKERKVRVAERKREQATTSERMKETEKKIESKKGTEKKKRQREGEKKIAAAI